MTPIPRIKSVTAIPDTHRLRLSWRDGSESEVDMTGTVFRVAAFAGLHDPAAFARVEPIDAGCAIAWTGTDLDFSSGALARLAEEQAPFAAGDFAAWQDALRLSNQEAADFLDVSLGTVKNYRSVGNIPKPVRMACRATLRDPAVLQAHFRPRVAGRPRREATPPAG